MLKMLRSYFRMHRQAFSFVINQFMTVPLASFVLILVIGFALSLPMFLWVTSINAKHFTRSWQRSAQISIFLDHDLSNRQSKEILKELRQLDGVEYANYISPELGLQQLEEQTGMNDVAQLLKDNPLPAVIELHPKVRGRGKTEALLERLKTFRGVSQVKLDMQWVLRLKSLLDFAENVASGLMGILCFAVLLVVGNTIRLMIGNKRKELEVLQLIGATNNYIRRPFLYFGFVHGLLGAIVAWIVVSLMTSWLQLAMGNIAKLYYTHVNLQGLGFLEGITLLILGCLLGILGAAISVARQLSKFNSGLSF